jgi:integrase
MYSVVPEHYTWPLSFWKRGMASLVKGKKISKAYSLKQIRPTLASYLINKLKMDIYTVKKLLDHSDVKITDNHYIDFRVDNVRKELDEIELNNFIK